MNNSIIIECTFRYIIYYNDRQETTLSFFSILYFNIWNATLRDKYVYINEKDISKGVAKFILNFGGTEIVKPVDVSI